MSNRVEELESRVTELQAAVDGLTEELVETRERLRALEEDAAGRTRNETVTSDTAHARTIDAEDGNAEVETTDDPAEGSDAQDEPETDAEPTEEASTESPSESDSESPSESDSDDIIVA